MVPDIVEIKRLCASGQWKAYAEDGKIFLRDTVAGETVCVSEQEEQVRWLFSSSTNPKYRICSHCGAAYPIQAREGAYHYCPDCGKKAGGGASK